MKARKRHWKTTGYTLSQCAEVYSGKTDRLSSRDKLPFRADKLPRAIKESI